jgi:hypothetical protein
MILPSFQDRILLCPTVLKLCSSKLNESKISHNYMPNIIAILEIFNNIDN